MLNQQWLTELFNSVDDMNTEDFIAYLAKDCTFRFANIPAATGTIEIRSFLNHFFSSISSLSHNVSAFWEVPEGLVCHGFVTYTRHNSSTLTVPFSNIFTIKNKKIAEYLIFADTSALYTD